MIHRHYLVTGRVQGVGFRAFTAKRGEALGLKGRVRNLEDGRVEAVASGSAQAIAAFEEALRRGPMLARVEKLETRELPVDSALLTATSFERDEDGEEPWT